MNYEITTRRNNRTMSSHTKTVESVAVGSKKKIWSNISTLGVSKLKQDVKQGSLIHPKIGLTDLKSETKDKSDHVLPERSGSFDDYIHERFSRHPVEHPVETNVESFVEDDDYYNADSIYEKHEDYDSFEEEEYYEHEYIEKADARPTTVRAGGGGTKIPFHSGRGTRAKEANIAKGTVLLANGNILIK